MDVLVTGGAGFIGSHLVEALLARDHQVVVLDDLSTGSLENLHAVAKHLRLEFVQGSVLDRDLVWRLVTRVQCVYHLAAAVGFKLVMEQTAQALKTNVIGAENVIGACAVIGRRLLLVSSSAVYGKSDLAVCSETDDVVYGAASKLSWSYGTGKLVDEFLALAYHRECGLDVRIVRLFNTVGPRQSALYGMVLPRFVEQALQGEPLTVYGDGKQVRTFTDVADAIRGILLVADHPDAGGQVFNVGGDESVSIAELAERVIGMVDNLTGIRSTVRFLPYLDVYGEGFEDVLYRVPNLAKIEALGYHPTTSLKGVVARTIEYRRRQGVTA